MLMRRYFADKVLLTTALTFKKIALQSSANANGFLSQSPFFVIWCNSSLCLQEIWHRSLIKRCSKLEAVVLYCALKLAKNECFSTREFIIEFVFVAKALLFSELYFAVDK